MTLHGKIQKGLKRLSYSNMVKEETFAIVSDIHANKPALNILLDYLTQHPEIDMVLNLGDTVGIGPHPKEVAEIVFQDKRFINIVGNNDLNTFINPMEEPNPGEVAHIQWVKESLGIDLINQFKKLSLHIRIQIGEKMWLMVHSRRFPNPPMDMPLLYQHKSIKQFAEDYPKDVSCICFGHIHEQCLLHFENQIFISPGSVGCSRSYGSVSFCIVQMYEDMPQFEFKNIPYDIEGFKAEFKNRNVPDANHIIQYFYSQ